MASFVDITEQGKRIGARMVQGEDVFSYQLWDFVASMLDLWIQSFLLVNIIVLYSRKKIVVLSIHYLYVFWFTNV